MSSTVAADPPSSRRIWLNGRLYEDATEARLPVTDHGVVVGDGVFEALKVTQDGVFAVTRHLRRMQRSTRALGLPDPDPGLVREAIRAVTDGASYAYGKIRITYTAGLGPLGSQAAFGPTSLVVIAEESTAPAETASLVTVPWTRNENGALAGVKSTSYAENVRALAHATERGASEAIFANTAGHLCEGTGSNIFCVFGSEIVTPPLSAGPLAGITREVLLGWCPIVERDLTMEEARRADEVFITSSLRDVQAVTRWDDLQFDAPGPQSALAAKIFLERSADELDP
jgi:branched-chain amino acid aminotransferase